MHGPEQCKPRQARHLAWCGSWEKNWIMHAAGRLRRLEGAPTWRLESGIQGESMTNEKLCRWGILGAANIAKKNWDSIRNAENATLLAVASRSKAKAEEYVRECQLTAPHEQTPAACTYEELLARKDIDAVYIPLPTGIRKEWVIKAAK